MFNTGLFVLEVQKRPCIWNLKDSSHNDRMLKLLAWKEIAKVFNTSSNPHFHKNITVDVLQRKWKHLRDYYIREKKRAIKADQIAQSGGNEKGNSVRKRNSPLLDMLQFLDGMRGTDVVEITTEKNVEDRFYLETNEEEDKSISEYELNSRPTKTQRIEVQQSNVNPLAEDNEDSTDKQFLASLLPIVKNMSTNEKLKFRAQLKNQIPSQENPLSSDDEEEKRRTPEIRKRRRVTCKPVKTEVVNKETKSAGATARRDEYSIYGEYVANKLRNIRNKQARHTAEFHINSILYKAQMGDYDNIAREEANSTRSASDLVLTRESQSTRTIETLTCEEDSDDTISTDIKSEAE